MVAPLRRSTIYGSFEKRPEAGTGLIDAGIKGDGWMKISRHFTKKDKSPYADIGTKINFEIKVEHIRILTPAIVVKTPFFNPERKRSCLI